MLLGDSVTSLNEQFLLENYVYHRIVMVTASYRLGLLGFLDLGAAQPDAPYNVALYGE